MNSAEGSFIVIIFVLVTTILGCWTYSNHCKLAELQGYMQYKQEVHTHTFNKWENTGYCHQVRYCTSCNITERN